MFTNVRMETGSEWRLTLGKGEIGGEVSAVLVC